MTITRTVIPVSFESFGRLDGRSIDIVRSLATDLIAHGGRRNIYCELRVSMERALLTELADVVLLSFKAHLLNLHGNR